MKHIGSIMWMILIFVFSNNAKAQNDFEEAQKRSFVKVYLQMKSMPTDHDADVMSYLEEFHLSKDRVEILMKKQLTGEKIILSKNEELFIEKVEELNNEFEKKKKTYLVKLCEEHRIAEEIYYSIFALYKRDIAFQRSLKPFFDEIIAKNDK